MSVNNKSNQDTSTVKPENSKQNNGQNKSGDVAKQPSTGGNVNQPSKKDKKRAAKKDKKKRAVAELDYYRKKYGDYQTEGSEKSEPTKPTNEYNGGKSTSEDAAGNSSYKSSTSSKDIKSAKLDEQIDKFLDNESKDVNKEVVNASGGSSGNDNAGKLSKAQQKSINPGSSVNATSSVVTNTRINEYSNFQSAITATALRTGGWLRINDESSGKLTETQRVMQSLGMYKPDSNYDRAAKIKGVID